MLKLALICCQLVGGSMGVWSWEWREVKVIQTSLLVSHEFTENVSESEKLKWRVKAGVYHALNEEWTPTSRGVSHIKGGRQKLFRWVFLRRTNFLDNFRLKSESENKSGNSEK